MLSAQSAADLLLTLPLSGQRGSKPRCHFLTHGSRVEVAARLKTLVSPYAIITPQDRWMPDGFDEPEEAQLDKAPRLLGPENMAQLGSWWLARNSRRARTPNFDIASTCRIDGSFGYMLVEAKAHAGELHEARLGKSLDDHPNDAEQISHDKIEAAIIAANDSIIEATGLAWGLTRDRCYQMSNRFAWAWKLTELGFPVVIVYLGFLQAEEMVGRKLLRDHAEWESLVLAHSAGIVPSEAWDRSWNIGGCSITPVIRSQLQSLGVGH